MLIIGDYNCIPSYMENLLVFNLSSIKEGYTPLCILPTFKGMDYNSLEFDYYLAEYIYANDNIFFEFFNNVIYQLYSGNHVFIMVQRGDFFDAISESILKLVQQRYGYHGAIVNCLEDIDYMNPDEGFNILGINNLDADKERWTAIYTRMYGVSDNGYDVRIGEY